MQSTGVQAYEILAYIFGILAVILNAVLLLSVYNERKKIFVTRASYLVANLAVADCLIGLFLIVFQSPIAQIEFISRLHFALVWTAFCVSYFTVLVMAAERSVLIMLPMAWSTLLTIRRTIFSILAVWILSIIAGVVMYNDKYRHHAQFFICLFVEIFAFLFFATHLYISCLLHRREKHRARVNEYPDQDTPRSANTENIAQSKVTIVVSILLVILIVSIVPYFVCLQLFTIHNTFDDTVGTKIDPDVYEKAYHYTDAFLYVNFFANPIIYAWRLRIYRKAFYRLFCFYRRLFRQHSS